MSKYTQTMLNLRSEKRGRDQIILDFWQMLATFGNSRLQMRYERQVVELGVGSDVDKSI